MSPASAMMAAAPLGERWHDFYLLAGTAAVTLVGLLFVSLSLHVQVLFQREHGHFREMALQAFQGYLYVLVSALVFLLPANNPRWQLWTYGAINVAMLIRGLFRVPAFLKARRARFGSAAGAGRFGLPFVAYGLGILASVEGLRQETNAALTLLAPVMLMLISATRMAWDILEYVGKTKAGGSNPAESP
jgi:hypothetical protein